MTNLKKDENNNVVKAIKSVLNPFSLGSSNIVVTREIGPFQKISYVILVWYRTLRTKKIEERKVHFPGRYSKVEETIKRKLWIYGSVKYGKCAPGNTCIAVSS